MKLQHFVIVRINLRMPGFNWKRPAGDVDGIPTPEWTGRRMKLFRQYCYPSLLNQRNQDFELLLLFDDETTDRKLLKGLDRVTPVFLDKEPPWRHQIPNIVKDRLRKGTEWVLTTRIDSDDAYRYDYVRAMQRLAREFKTSRVLYCPTGYVYNVKMSRLRRVLRAGWYTCFLSRLESVRDRIRTCYGGGMHGWKGISPDDVEAQTVLRNRPVWVQVIHDENIATHTGTDGKQYGAVDVPLSVLKSFNIEV